MFVPVLTDTDADIHYGVYDPHTVSGLPKLPNTTFCGKDTSRVHITYVLDYAGSACEACIEHLHRETAHPDDGRHHVVETGYAHTLEIRDKHVLTVDAQGTVRANGHYGTGALTVFAYDRDGCPPVNLDPRGTYREWTHKEKMTAVYNATNIAVYVPNRGRLTVTDSGDIELDGVSLATRDESLSLPLTGDPESGRVYTANGNALYKHTDDRVITITPPTGDLPEIEIQASRVYDNERDTVHAAGGLILYADGDYDDGARFPTVRVGRFNEVSVANTADVGIGGSDAVDWVHVSETRVRFGLNGVVYQVTRDEGVTRLDGTPLVPACDREHVEGHKATDWRAVTHGNGRLDIHVPGWTITLPDGPVPFAVAYDHALGGFGEALADALQAKRGYSYK